MKFVWVLFVAALINNAYGGRIVGGETTTLSQYPSIVQVEFRNVLSLFWTQSCAGNIITNVYILSAAHCFNDNSLFAMNNRRIRVGSERRHSGTIIGLSRRVNHPSFSTSTLDGNISVVRLSSTLTFSLTIRPITIVPQGFVLPDNVSVVHAGWGSTVQGGSSSSTLRKVEVLTVNRTECVARYSSTNRVITDNMICSNISDGNKGSCQGDGGGPMYFNNVMLVGIISHGEGCGQPNFPDINTNIGSYSQWIIRTAV